jgi:hypothetical protein
MRRHTHRHTDAGTSLHGPIVTSTVHVSYNMLCVYVCVCVCVCVCTTDMVTYTVHVSYSHLLPGVQTRVIRALGLKVKARLQLKHSFQNPKRALFTRRPNVFDTCLIRELMLWPKPKPT